ncbi:MAG: alpha/beta hydrolase [Deltaproteobacteria bacterium]|nr:alpha/beta hydrolase [Deltaproteobacteria bacterium]
MRALALVMLFGCSNTPITIADSGTDTGLEADTDTDTDTDTDADADSDSDADSDADTDADTDTDVGNLTDFTADGGGSVTTSTASETLTSCSMSYTRYSPGSGAAGPLVVLSHGFARGQAEMANWAGHLASWGVDVITPSLCHASLFDTDHAQNGADLVELVTALGASNVIYVGHSAGGLASYAAAAADSRTLALFGLDPVDNDLAGGLTVTAPSAAVHGVAQQCNTNNNMIGFYDRELRVTDADHCDFENPTNGLCSFGCPSGGSGFTDEQIRSAIGQQLTAFVLWQAGLEADGAAYWETSGAGYQALIGSGAASAL